MSVTGLPDPYCTVAYADGINLAEPWLSATTDEKEAALQWGRVYIDGEYTCSVWTGDAPLSVQTANAMLGNYNLASALYDPSAATALVTGAGVTSEEVSAGSVSSKKGFDAYARFTANSVDMYPDVTAVLGSDGSCTLAQSSVQVLDRR